MFDTRINVLWTMRYRYEPGWSLEPHFHDCYQISHLIGEGEQFLLDGVSYRIDGPELFLVKPGQVHGLTAAGTVDMFDVKFNVHGAGLERHLMAAGPVITPTGGDILSLFERIRVEGERQRPFYREICGTYAAEILLYFLRRWQQEQPVSMPHVSDPEAAGDGLLGRLMDLIRREYQSSISGNDMACRLGCSERTLRRHAQAALGLGPMELLQRYRVERAKELMEYSEVALKQVAESVGFKNVFHFTRAFSGIAGTPPGAWRRRYLDGIRKEVRIDSRFTDRDWTILRAPSMRRRSAQLAQRPSGT